jgi:hypothetical protein
MNPRFCDNDLRFHMGLTLGLTSTRDLFAKLQRDASLLRDEVTCDRFFNFVVTGYSLIDWVKNDLGAPQKVVDCLHKVRSLKICGDIANAYKHFTLDRRVPITKQAKSAQGFGVGRYGKSRYGHGEQSIIVELDNGKTFNCFRFVRRVLSVWKKFLAHYGISRV